MDDLVGSDVEGIKPLFSYHKTNPSKMGLNPKKGQRPSSIISGSLDSERTTRPLSDVSTHLHPFTTTPSVSTCQVTPLPDCHVAV